MTLTKTLSFSHVTKDPTMQRHRKLNIESVS